MDLKAAGALLDLFNTNSDSKADTLATLEGYVTDETRSRKEKQCDNCKGWCVFSETGSRRLGTWICQHCSDSPQAATTRSKNLQHSAVAMSPKRKQDDLGNSKPKRLCKQPSADRLSAASAIVGISDACTAHKYTRGEPLTPLLRSKRVIANRVSTCMGSSSHDARSAEAAPVHTEGGSADREEAAVDAYATPRPLQGSKWVAPLKLTSKDSVACSQVAKGVPTSSTNAKSQLVERVLPAQPVPLYPATEWPSRKAARRLSGASEVTLTVLATYFKIQRSPDLQARKMLADRSGISLQKVDEWFWFRNKLELVEQAKLQRALQRWNVLQASGAQQ